MDVRTYTRDFPPAEGQLIGLVPDPEFRLHPALSWLEEMDVVFRPEDDSVVIRLHTPTGGYQDVEFRRLPEKMRYPAPWCQTCRREITPKSPGSGEYAHRMPTKDGHEAVPGDLAGRVMIKVPFEGMPLGALSNGRVLKQIPVIGIAPGHVVLGDI